MDRQPRLRILIFDIVDPLEPQRAECGFRRRRGAPGDRYIVPLIPEPERNMGADHASAANHEYFNFFPLGPQPKTE